MISAPIYVFDYTIIRPLLLHLAEKRTIDPRIFFLIGFKSFSQTYRIGCGPIKLYVKEDI